MLLYVLKNKYTSILFFICDIASILEKNNYSSIKKIIIPYKKLNN